MFFSRFKNREEAGKKLAEELLDYRGKDTVVLAIPRGGVVTAYEIAKALDAPLDIIIPRKIGAPGNPELAIGAVTEDGTLILNEDLVARLQISKEYIEEVKKAEMEEIRRRKKMYRGNALINSFLPNIRFKTVILVDDGIATGATVRAAIKSVRRQKPRAVIVAVPAAPPEAVRALEREVDEVVCLVVFEPFYAIGQFYEDFSQVSDGEVIEFLKRSRKT